MNICYLINQYPKISHTFIRREIQALERLGATVARVSVRGVDEGMVSDEDAQELKKTTFIIGASSAKSLAVLALNLLLTLLRLPRVAASWYRLSSAANGAYLKHCIYVMEACWLLRFCHARNIDHIHAHFGTNPATVALFCRLLGGPTYSFTVHGPEEFDSPIALSLREKIKQAKFTVAITSFCKSQLYRWAAFDDWSKIKEVHCTIDDTLLMQGPPAKAKPHRLVSVGRLCEQKGQWLLLQAIKQLSTKYPAIELHLIGGGEFRAVFEAYVKANSLEKNVVFYGWQGGEAIKTQLDLAQAMVLPSFAEGLPVVIMEAFARKKPVISTAIAGIPELVNAGNGWLISAGSIDQLVSAIDSVFSSCDDSLLAKGQAGFTQVTLQHNANIEAKKLYALIGGQ